MALEARDGSCVPALLQKVYVVSANSIPRAIEKSHRMAMESNNSVSRIRCKRWRKGHTKETSLLEICERGGESRFCKLRFF